MIRSFLNKIIQCFVVIMFKCKLGKYICGKFVEVVVNQKKSIAHNGHELVFSIPNFICQYRADTFSEKEPDTLEWLDNLSEEQILWDIGANIGSYSIYAAKARNCKVYAFEPSVFNLEFLARNIYETGVVDNVAIVPIALSGDTSFNKFKLSATSWGGALSVFGESYDHNGEELKDIFSYNLAGMTMDDVAKLLNIPMPDYIKIDVDGIEHLILGGGSAVLNHAQSVLIEINDEFPEQSERALTYLKEAGLTLQEKTYLDVAGLYNQIWARNTAE